jgi:hypothetical protein
MGFLDNLEDSLKNLEASDERGPGERARREADRSQAASIRPWADQLKNSAYTKDLFDKAAVAGHKIRAKVYIAWIEEWLRLEARGRVLELKPTKDGIVANYTRPDGTPVVHPVDLASDPAVLLEEWLSGEQLPGKEEGAELNHV